MLTHFTGIACLDSEQIHWLRMVSLESSDDLASSDEWEHDTDDEG
jgi:hypothetical protein